MAQYAAPMPACSTRTIVRLLCALLLFAQQIALGHALLHAAHVSVEHVERASDDGQQDPNGQKVAGACSFDAVFGQVLGCAPGSQFLGLPIVAVPQALPNRSSPAGGIEVPTPRSRGPPAYL
jgi:hypothetical protein